MARRDENILELLSQGPWWLSIALSAGAFVGFGVILPAIGPSHPFLRGLAAFGQQFAVIIAFIFLLPAPFAYWNSLRKRKLVDKQTDLESIRSLRWKEFEELVAEAYRRKGYSVSENKSPGSDGGIDLVLTKSGNSYLVQCKQWRTQKVNVRVVREMYGVMTAERATGVIIITSGVFTHDAKAFAENKPIDLIEGHQVADLIQNVQRKSYSISHPAEEDEKTCHRCNSKLVLRVARRGRNRGDRFWGCSNYPQCKFTEAFTE
jgi:restriction system protein